MDVIVFALMHDRGTPYPSIELLFTNNGARGGVVILHAPFETLASCAAISKATLENKCFHDRRKTKIVTWSDPYVFEVVRATITFALSEAVFEYFFACFPVYTREKAVDFLDGYPAWGRKLTDAADCLKTNSRDFGCQTLREVYEIVTDKNYFMK